MVIFYPRASNEDYLDPMDTEASKSKILMHHIVKINGYISLFSHHFYKRDLLILSRVGQGYTALAEGAGGGCLDIFSLVYHFSLLSLSLLCRLKYCLKRPLSPKQPTNKRNLFLDFICF